MEGDTLRNRYEGNYRRMTQETMGHEGMGRSEGPQVICSHERPL
jgi:hypothetical protein